MFNQSDSVLTYECLTESASGAFCSDYIVFTEITYNYMNLLVLLSLPVFLYLFVKMFLKK